MNAADRTESSLEAVFEEYLTRVEHGDTPDTREYIVRYPKWAKELRQFFDDLNFVDSRMVAEKAEARTADLEQCFAQDVPCDDASSDDVSARPDLPRVRGFVLLEELGSGGQGIVYKAQQPGTKRTVALKVIREGAFASKAERRRFEGEVELASRLSHPNIVAIYECGQDSGRDYFAMEYVEGEPLDVHVSKRTLDISATLDLFLQLCDAVGYAHRHGVIHRDLKPSNVIIDASGHARIVDFGLAKAIPDGTPVTDAAVTRVGEFAGTWYYASPEQAQRDPNLVDLRTDVYSLGVILYEMLTDCHPYPIHDESRESIAKHILHTPPTRPSLIRRDIDDDLETIILRTLQKETERRYQSVAALGEDIHRYLAGEAIEAKRDSPWYVLRKAVGRYRWQVAAAGTAMAVLLAFAVTVSILYSQAVSARATTEVRADIVRGAQAYTLGKLDELNWASNRLSEITLAHPELPEVRALAKERLHDPWPLLCGATEDMPTNIHETVMAPNEPGYAAAVVWLDAHQQGLDEIEARTETSRFVFGVRTSPEDNRVIADNPGRLDCVLYACQALAARTVHRDSKGDHEKAVRSLEGARSLAVDLADGRLTHHKAVSLYGRSLLYDVVLTLLARQCADEPAITAYADWVLCDPPLPQYRYAMIAARQKAVQSVEHASLGTTPGDSGHLDLDLLDESAGGVYAHKGALTRENRSLARATTSDDVLSLLDAYTLEAESWDSLTHKELRERQDRIASELRRDRVYRFAEPLLGGVREGFELRGRIRAKRAAAILAARLCRYYAANGHWPDTLGRTDVDGTHIVDTDPYTGLSFGYKLIDGRPLLYSVNEDGVDNGGKNGDWGQPGTDVVFFMYPPP